MRARGTLGAMVLFLTASWFGGAQEPVDHPQLPLVEGSEEIDFSSCLLCHAEKNTGPVVHPALEMGCESCHEVDRDEDYTEIFLATEGNDLCLTCHGDKQPEDSQLQLHPPVRREQCIVCHDPHSSEAESLLLRPTEGSTPEENLCLGCHTNITEQLKKETPHGAIEFGCSTCHTTHKSEPEDSFEGQFHLTVSSPDLCLTCHDIEDETLQTAHSGQPFQTAQCSGCHNPHGSDNAKLLNNYIHGAFEMGCETCHEDPKEGKVVLQEGAGKDMCLMCHSDIEEQMEQASLTHFPLEMDDGCITCHNPHAATYDYLLTRGPVKTCLTCHTELAEARAAKDSLHQPVFEQSCVICHQPHTGERERLLRAEANDLCLGCHGSQMLNRIESRKSVRLFGGAVEVAAEAFKDIRIIPVRSGQTFGHPMVAHPVAGSEKNITCLTCHTPHAADGSQKLFITEEKGKTALCIQCH